MKIHSIPHNFVYIIKPHTKMPSAQCSLPLVALVVVVTLTTTIGHTHAGSIGLTTPSSTESTTISTTTTTTTTTTPPAPVNRFQPLPPHRIVGTSTERSIAAELLQPTLPNIVSDLNEDYDTLERRRRIQVGLCEVGCLKDVSFVKLELVGDYFVRKYTI